MSKLTNPGFWILGGLFACVPAASMLQDYQMISLSGWPHKAVQSYELWRNQGVQLLADGLELVSQGVRAMEVDASNVVVILLALALAAFISGGDEKDEKDPEETGAAGPPDNPVRRG